MNIDVVGLEKSSRGKKSTSKLKWTQEWFLFCNFRFLHQRIFITMKYGTSRNKYITQKCVKINSNWTSNYTHIFAFNITKSTNDVHSYQQIFQ